MAQFEQDWSTVYHRIRADDPGALIAGPNTSYYDPTVMSDFLSYAKASDVLPDIITWHELSPSSLRRGQYAHVHRRQGGAGRHLPCDAQLRRR